MTPTSIGDLLARVRSRRQRLLTLKAVLYAATASAVLLAGSLTLVGVIDGRPIMVSFVGFITLLALALVVAWSLRSARAQPSDLQIARLIEEHHPALDDRLVSAVSLLSQESDTRPALAAALLDDAGRAAGDVDPGVVVGDERLRRAGVWAAAAVAALVVVSVVGRHQIRDTFDAMAMVAFPSHVTLRVTPGSVRIAAGAPLTIDAHLVGTRVPVDARLLRAKWAAGAPEADRREWEAVDMIADGSGGFRAQLGAVSASFAYRVVAGTLSSATYDVTVAHPPRVTRIDVDYRFPAALGMAPQTEEDGGDIYAPAGTEVRLHVHTDRDAVKGTLNLTDGSSLTLADQGVPSSGGEGDGAVLTTSLTVDREGSYRVALVDADGFSSPGDTEYFIRTLDDRPPEVHIRKPARDRSVSMLEEVEIEAEAEDDFGIERLDLVYAIRGDAEHVVPLTIPPSQASVTARQMIYLEDLGVQPGDFVSYYVRARDKARGKRSSEGRSDIFFLEIKPFEQEFVMAQTQATGSGRRSLDDLVATQKEVIVATWKLDRRAQAAGAKSTDDIKEVAHTEDELKTRVEETSSAFRETNMRDPRARPQPGRGQPPAVPAGQARPEEDAMTAAARAMGAAVTSLNRLQTEAAIPSEMDALNHLLRAQADVRRQQISRQNGNGGGNRQAQDMSSLFDRELRKAQETNYETPASSSPGDKSNLADKVKELARRQDELNQRQQQSASLGADERRRQLEQLTRDQNQLRRDAEDVAGQMRESQGSKGSRGSQGSPGSPGSSSGSQGGRGAQGARGSRSSQSQQGSAGEQQMRAASEEMRNAANGLERQDAREASARGARAAEQLKNLERQLRSNGPDEQRRALGDLQLEARQLADAERKISDQIQGSAGARGSNSGSQGSQSASGSGGPVTRDELRRLAGEQERLADRARQVQESLAQQATAVAGSATDAQRDLQHAVGAVASDANRQRLGDRLRQNAEQLRAAAGQASDRQAVDQAAKAVEAQEAAARDLENLADKLAGAQTPQDEATQKLADQRDRVQELRDEINRLGREIERAGQTSTPSSGSSAQKSQGDAGQSGRGQSGSGGTGGDLAKLQQEYNQRLQEARQLIDQLKRDDPTFSRGGPGLTFEGQGMTLSAPGTESFKQDFAKWDQLRQQANVLLDRAESSLSQRLQAKAASDRLSAGATDRAPSEYQRQVDDYFRALATQKVR